MNKLSSLLILFILAMPASPTAHAEKIDGIAANADGQLITISELKKRLSDTKTDKSKALDVLNKMIEETLVDSEIRKRGLNASKAEIEDAINQIMRQNGLRTYEELLQVVKQQGTSEELFRNNLKNQIEQGKFVNYVIGAKIKISDTEIKQYYNDNYLNGKAPEQYRLRSIFLKAKKSDVAARQKAELLMKTIQKKLAAKSDFIALAKKYSDGPDASTGGLMGDFSADELQEDFAAVVRHLKPGEISEVVKHDEGLYLFKLQEMVRSSAPSMKSVENEISLKLRNQEMDRLFRLWMQQTREKAFIDIRLKDISSL